MSGRGAIAVTGFESRTRCHLSRLPVGAPKKQGLSGSSREMTYVDRPSAGIPSDTTGDGVYLVHPSPPMKFRTQILLALLLGLAITPKAQAAEAPAGWTTAAPR